VAPWAAACPQFAATTIITSAITIRIRFMGCSLR
jgi:hypothetical protein